MFFGWTSTSDPLKCKGSQAFGIGLNKPYNLQKIFLASQKYRKNSYKFGKIRTLDCNFSVLIGPLNVGY